MDVRFFDLGGTSPAVIIRHVQFFNCWTVLADELASYYGEKRERFVVVEASWNNEDEYAQVVTLNGHIIGALDRPLTHENVASILGVKTLQKQAFINRIRSLSNIEAYQLPELTEVQQSQFLRDPRGFFLNADVSQSDAIMREVERRQRTPVKKRKKRSKPRVREQGEFLLPISGKEPVADDVGAVAKANARRKHG